MENIKFGSQNLEIIVAGEYWLRDVVQLERQVLASGGASPPADAFTINGHPGPNYNCSGNGKNLTLFIYAAIKIKVVIE